MIYVTEATIGKEEPFLLQAAAIAFRERPVQVVMTSGRQRNAAEVNIGRPTPNIRVESYIPQSDLLPKAAVMVTLGGSGGVLAALKAGVPLVIVPNDWDRPENAQRVVEAGAGLRIAVHECTPERLRAAVERLLTEPSFKENAQRLSRAFQGYGADRAVGLLEDWPPIVALTLFFPPLASLRNRLCLTPAALEFSNGAVSDYLLAICRPFVSANQRCSRAAGPRS